MSEPSADRDPFEVVAESFLGRFRAGHRPSIEEYAASHPELADQIRELLPALVMVEQDLTVDRNSGPAGPTAPPTPSPFKEWRLGDYRIMREVGRGGMGVVYEAEQVSLGRRVALKVLPGHFAGNGTALERFRREAKAAARLHHTNIVPVYEVGRDGEVAYYAMQFIQGQGLDQVIDELTRLRDTGPKAGGVEDHSPTAVAAASGPVGPAIGRIAESLLSGRIAPEGTAPTADVPPATPDDPKATEPIARDATRPPGRVPASREPARPGATSDPRSRAMLPGGSEASTTYLSGRRATYFRSVARIGRQTAQGLAYAHAGGIVHRDIKPSNLLLDHAGVVWIADFGLAKADDDGLTQSGDLLGTLRYMAPERFRGQGDGRADVYALGLTLYELLTLRPAFESTDRLKLIERIKSEEPRRPRDVDPRVPRDLETIVLKAIEKDPRARYQSVEAMAEDLRLFLADEPIRARQVSATERYWRWARRNPAVAALGAVLTTLLVATSVGSTWAASYFRTLAGSESLARKDAVDAQKQAVLERDRSLRLSANLALDKGFALAEEGHADRGLLWMLEALKTAPDDAEGFRRAVRWNLGAWLGQVHKALRITGDATYDLLAFSPDGRSYVTGSFPQTASHATLWDTASGRELSSLPGAFAPFAFRPDGKVIVASTEEGRRMVAVDATGRVVWTTPDLPGKPGLAVHFSPDGSTILAERDSRSNGYWLIRLDAATGQQRGEPIRGSEGIAVSPDGRTVAAQRVENGKAYIDVCVLPSGRRTASWRAGGRGLVRLLFSPDGKSLFGRVIGDDDSDFSQIWDLGTGKPSSPLMVGMITPSNSSYTPSGDRLVTEADFQQLVCDITTGSARGSGFLAAGGPVSHPDGRTMLVKDLDNSLRLWQISADAERVPAGGTNKQASMKGSLRNRKWRGFNAFRSGLLRADGQIAVSLADGAGGRESIRLSDTSTGRPSGRPAPHHPGWIVRAVAFSPDGRCFATGSNPMDRFAGELRLWDANTGRSLLPPMPQTNWVAALAFQPDGKILATGDYDGLVRFWDTSTGLEIGRPLPSGEMVLSLAYSPDGKMIAAGLASEIGKNGTRLWDTRTRQPIGELLPSTEHVSRIEFRPDGRAMLASIDSSHSSGSTRLWDTTRGQLIGEPMIAEAAGGFRPDGRAFVTLGRDGTVKLRDATTGEVLAKLLTSSSPAACAAFLGDGGLIAAGFEDGAVRLCDPATSQPIGPPRFMRHAVHQVVFTSDGRTVAAIDEFGESRTWPVPEPLQDSSLDDLTLRIEGRTGLRMETGLAISRLDGPAWRERLGRLDPSALRLETDPAWHEPMILEAEQNGNAFAALWHLDRLIAARPDDWFLRARRARAWASSDQFDKAAADYEQSERLGKREDVLDTLAHRVIDCTRAERWAEALWYLDRLIAARPGDGTLHEERAAVYGKLGREADRQAELARVFELGADGGLVIPRAEELGRAGRWAEAAGLLARCGRTGPLSRELAQAWGIACLKSGNQAGYREACKAVVARDWPDPAVAWDALNAGSLPALADQGLDDYRVPIAWFERRLADVPVPLPVYHPYYFPNALGGLLLRAGRIDEAIVRLDEGTAAAKEAKFDDYPTDWSYLALAHARKGNVAEARRWLDRLRTFRPASSITYWDVQELALLREEAESLLSDAAFPSDPFQPPGPR